MRVREAPVHSVCIKFDQLYSVPVELPSGALLHRVFILDTVLIV